jgi:hypothetical protein
LATFVLVVRRSACQHLLDGLTGDAEFPCDLGLRDALANEVLHQVTSFCGELPRELSVPDGFGPDLADTDGWEDS